MTSIAPPICQEAPPDDAGPPRHLAVVGGLDAGHSVGLPHAGRAIAIGRSAGSAVHLDHPTVSRRHAMLDIRADAVTLADLGSRNGTHLDGRPRARIDLVRGDLVRLGGVAVEIREGPCHLPRRPSTAHEPAPPRPFNRPPRSIAAIDMAPLRAPAGEAVSQLGGGSVSVSMVLGPLAFGAVLAVLFSPIMAVFALMGPVMMLASWLERKLRDRRQRRRSAGVRRLSAAGFDADLRERLDQERIARRRRHPDPVTLRAWADGGSHMWERRADHDDAFQVSVGLAHLPWSPPIEPPAPGVDRGGTSPVLPAATQALTDAPVVATLGPGRALGVVGPATARSSVIRWLVCEIATLHGPADVELRLLTPQGAGGPTDDEWSFVADLPHHRPGSSGARGERAPGEPLDLVVVPDAAADGLSEPLTRLIGVGPPGSHRSGVVGADTIEQLPSWCTTIVELAGPDGRATVREPATASVVPGVLATGVSSTTSRQWAASLARHHDPELVSSSSGLPDQVTLATLLGDTTTESIRERWQRSRQVPSIVRAELGSVADRAGSVPATFAIDLVADGPHALIGGTTGSGKSELLRTLVLSLALGHGPDALSFLLVDYKGGSAFDACAELPHVVGLVTDLDEHLAARALATLDAEIRRREQLLRDAGVADLASVPPTTGPVGIARLVVVIDEFATLASELPGFLDALVDVAQRGRSLGVHLVLATQRPHGAVNDRIRTNTNLRIALRMLDRAESADVIDDPAASRLPRGRPGRAFARLGHDELVAFQTARAQPAHLRTLVDQIGVAAVEAGLPLPPTPWLPPLPASLELADLPAVPPASDVSVAIGLTDEPQHQRQRPWSWHPEQGNLLVYGMPGSGTTTTLATVGLALARRFGPDRCHLHAIADGSGGLDRLAPLPQVGSVIAADDLRRQGRLLRMLGDEVDRRRSETAGPASPRRQGPITEPLPAIVALVDDLPGVLRRFDTLDGRQVIDDLHRIFRDGPAVGVHLAVSGDRAGSIPAALASRTSQRIVLHLSDPFDLAALGLRPPARMATDTQEISPPPGRGLLGAGIGIEVQVAGVSDVASWEPAGRCDRGADGSRAKGPWEVGELPTNIAASTLVGAGVHTDAHASRHLVLPIGIGDRHLRPVGLELHTGDHALVVGPPRSGRTTALQVLARSAAALGNAAVVLTLTPRPSALRASSHVLAAADVVHLLSQLATAGHAETILVLVDDAELVDDPDGALAALATSARPGLHLVAAARTDRTRLAYGHWTTHLRSSGRGLALRPDPELDGNLWGVRLPRDPEGRRGVGRGFLVGDAEVELVQVAELDEHR